jgi:hypothetical protein
MAEDPSAVPVIRSSDLSENTGGRLPLKLRSIRVLAAGLALLSGLVITGATPTAVAVQAFQDRVVNADPADFTPHVLDGRVNAIVIVGTTVVVGGSFTQVAEPGGPTLARKNLFAFDAATGDISTGFAPGVNAKVFALATDGTSVFVGGEFSKSEGHTHRRIVKMDLAGAIDPGFGAQVTAGTGVYDLVYANGLLFMAGAFTAVNGTPRSGLAAVGPDTGALAPGIDVPFTGLHNGGISRVAKLDVTPDGTRLVAVGNFTTVAGEPREQIAILDLAPTTASLSNWATQRFVGQCAIKFDTYIRDVDISPDGSYFVVVTTGAWNGGSNAGVLCDTASRWPTAATGPDQQPTWVDYAGGDTTYSVAVTGAAVYVGGHFRWWNNPYAADHVGPGTVKRRGIAALDPINGLPLSWNPGRKLGEGVFALVATPEGLWVGNDTDEIGGEYHARLAFFPLQGGKPVPVHQPSTLPGDLYSVPISGCPSVDPSILYRVNAGGPAIDSLDCGQGWAVDDDLSPSPLHNKGSSTDSWTPVREIDGRVPATTPAQLFSSERWDRSGSPEMTWTFPVTPGTHVGVRLSFANHCFCTSHVGDRVFDVVLEGSTVLDNYDIVADVGNNVGTTRSFEVTSDGTITIEFLHVVQNPLVNAIELVDLDASPVVPPPATWLGVRTLNGLSVGTPSTLATPGIDWSHDRGTFITGNQVYLGWDTGRMYRRTFSGSQFGKPKPVYLRGLEPFFPVQSVTGMFLDGGRLYYTMAGDDQLYYRYFTPESNVIGAQTFVASGPGDGFTWGTVRGLTLAGGDVYAARTDGALYRIGWASGLPVPGSQTLVDASGAQAWASHGLFVRNG